MSTGSRTADEESFSKAIFNHDFNSAENLLPKVNIETQDYNGYTYLLNACVRNDVQVFEWLVQHGANISAQDRSSRNVIFIAIDNVSMDIIKLLTDEKQLLHTTYRGQNPLHEAVLVNQLDMVKLLVATGLDPDDQTLSKSNAFDLAHLQHDTAILEWLLTNKSFNIMDGPHDEKSKVVMLQSLFEKYGYQFLNTKCVERNLTIAEYAADMQQIAVLKWLKSKNVLPDETSPFDDARRFDDALFNHKFDVASKLLLKVDVETRDYNGNTYLMKACVNDDIEAFQWLIQSGASIDVQHKSGRNVMFIAIDNHSLDIVKWLINNKQLLSTTYRGQNPLHEAISAKGLDIVKLLVAAGIDLYHENQNGDNAFDLAQKYTTTTDDNILKWLLTNRSFEILEHAQCEQIKIAAFENLFQKYGYQYLNDKSAEKNSTIAETAARMGQIEVLLWLKSKNISVDESFIRDIEHFRRALFNDEFTVASKLLSKINIETRYPNGNTCLMEACVNNNVNVFEWLVNNGANINVQDKSGKNLIFMAINYRSVDIVTWLTNKLLLYTIYNGNSPLHEAVSLSQLDMVKLLVNAGIDPNVQNESKTNAFDLAQTQNDKVILEWLLTNKSFKIMHAAQCEQTKIADLVNLFDKYGYQYLNLRSTERSLTIAEYAAKINEVEVLKWLKSKNISVAKTLLNVSEFEDILFNNDFKTASRFLSILDINAQDYGGQTYLIKACIRSDVKVFDWLVQNGADIDIQDKAGRNLIFIAIESNCLEIVGSLVKDKRFLSTTYEGQTPLHKAILTNQLEMVKLMIASKVDPYLPNRYGVNALNLAERLDDKEILKWLLTNRSFEILDEVESEEEKVAILDNLFNTYGFEHLNHKSPERKMTIAEHAARMKQTEVLAWLRFNNIQIEEIFKDLDIEKELMNIVLLGETGVDKSTFINAFANYLNFQTLNQAESSDDIQSLIPSKFTVTDENFESREVKFGSDSNESEVPGASATQSTKRYAFETFNLKIQLFDTPGVGDTRGIGQDEKNLENLLRIIGEEKNIHGICILLKPNNARVNVLFEYCVKELLSRLQKDASRNIIFLFTNSRGTFYRPGDTVPALKKILDQVKSKPPNIAIPFTKDNTFCLDNEAFRFLIAKKNNIQFNDEDTDNFSKSWAISAKTSMNLLRYIKSIKPHKIQDTISLNDTRRIILRLCEPLAETTKFIEVNIRQNTRYKELLSDNTKNISELRELLVIPVLKLKIIELPYPMTVCTNQDCAEIITCEDVSYKHYKKACHAPCSLTKVLKEVVGAEELMSCYAMIDRDNTKVCRHDFCGHNFREHMHIYYKTEPYKSTIEDVNVMNKIKMKEIDIQDIQNKIKDLDESNKEYEEEKRFIQEAMATFAHFLKNNAITPYNDMYKKFIEYLIDSEAKLGGAGNMELIKKYEELIVKYEQYKKTLEEQLNEAQKLDPNQKAIVNAEQVTQLVEHLFTLTHTGETIRKLHGAKTTAAAAEIIETSRANIQPIKPKENNKGKSDKGIRAWIEKKIRG